MDAYAQDAEGPDPTVRLPHKVTTTLKDGRVIETQRVWARGTIRDPFTDADREAKFRDCCEGFLSSEASEAVLAMLADFGKIGSIRDLTKHLVFEATADRGERFATRYDTLAAQ
jgi:hypothetical protein